jgi:hypothetical protein
MLLLGQARHRKAVPRAVEPGLEGMPGCLNTSWRVELDSLLCSLRQKVVDGVLELAFSSLVVEPIWTVRHIGPSGSLPGGLLSWLRRSARPGGADVSPARLRGLLHLLDGHHSGAWPNGYLA